MALLDLSLVTQALIRLIQVHASSSDVWDGAGARSAGAEIGEWSQVPVSPVPATLAGTPTTAQMSVNLYHIGEDAHFKNQSFPGPETAAVRYTPMGLNLHYQLCVLAGDDADHQYRAQRLMGLAVKALHDYPNLTDETQIAGVSIFQGLDLANNDNRIRLSLQPIPYNEAVSFWTAGSTPPRLSAYYLASVILLEPEQPPRRAARVLSYAVYPMAMGRPRLFASENSITFQPPGVAERQTLELRPAEVPLAGPETRVSFTGVGLTGDEIQLLLRSLRWTAPCEVDAAWGVASGNDRVFATVQPRIGTEELLPGTYAASVRLVRLHTLPDGRVRRLTETSNETPFTITPYIEDPIGLPDDSACFTVTGGLFQHEELEEDDVQVFIGAERLQQESGDALGRGEFRVVLPHQLRICLPAGLEPGQHYPLRVMVNGAESAPRWIEVPA